MKVITAVHPGIILREYLGEITVSEAAAALDITCETLSNLLSGRSGINADMALRLEVALGTSPVMWLAMQAGYDLLIASQQRRPYIKPLIKPVQCH